MFEGLELFSSLSKAECDKLGLFCQTRFLKAGEVLFYEGDESTSMYVVKKWLLQAYTNKKILGSIWVGEMVGEMAIFNEPQYRMASVKALEDAELIVIISYSLEELIKRHPQIIEKIQEVIAKRRMENAILV